MSQVLPPLRMQKAVLTLLLTFLAPAPCFAQKETVRKPIAKKAEKKRAAIRRPDFEKPEIRDIVVDLNCKRLLLRQSDQLELAGYAQKLLAWTPLITLAGENSPPFTAFSIITTDWEGLANGLANIDKIIFSSMASESLIHAITHDGEPKVKKFWEAMSDFYASQIPTPPASTYVIGTWKGTQKAGRNSWPFTLVFQKTGSVTTCQFIVPTSQRPCRNLTIGSNDSISFSVTSTDFRGAITIGTSSMNGTWIQQVYSGTWTAKKQP